ncbi:MAG: DNA-methyltransferase [Thermoflexibacteraceae bacterium]
MPKKLHITIEQGSCYEKILHLPKNSIDGLVTDPPYGISFQNQDWDKPIVQEDIAGNTKKNCPNPKIWAECFRVLKHGAFGFVFSFPRVMHRVMADLEDNGFIIKDVLMWVYLNGMPKSRNIGLDIDKLEGVESKIVGEYNYVQGYVPNGADTYKTKQQKYKLKPASEKGKKYDGAGLGIKPSYEPIILVQKPIEKGLNVAENLLKYGTGALNLEATRIPYEKGESKVGHNPHPKGRVPANILRTDKLNDNNDKYFFYGEKDELLDSEDIYLLKELFYPKVRQNKEDFNIHPTLKPVPLMEHLVQLIGFDGHTILDPFMGSGSTGVACVNANKNFVGYELAEEYFVVAQKRINYHSAKLF